MRERVRKLIGLSVVAVCAIVALGVGALVFAILSSDDPAENAPELHEQDGRAFVPEERVPRDYNEALGAAPVEVLPNRLPAEVSEVPADGRQYEQLRDAAGSFLRAWETYSPGAPGYQQAISKRAAPGAAERLILRTEVQGQGNACYIDGTCLMRSKWLGGKPRIKVMSLEQNEAWVNTYGLVELKPIVPGIETEPVPGIYERSYSLMLRFDSASGRWLVERALSETLTEAVG